MKARSFLLLQSCLFLVLANSALLRPDRALLRPDGNEKISSDTVEPKENVLDNTNLMDVAVEELLVNVRRIISKDASFFQLLQFYNAMNTFWDKYGPKEKLDWAKLHSLSQDENKLMTLISEVAENFYSTTGRELFSNGETFDISGLIKLAKKLNTEPDRQKIDFIIQQFCNKLNVCLSAKRFSDKTSTSAAPPTPTTTTGSTTTVVPPLVCPTQRVVCHYNQRTEANNNFTVDSMRPDLCSHIVVTAPPASLEPAAAAVAQTLEEFYNSQPVDTAMLGQLRAANPRVQLVLAAGACAPRESVQQQMLADAASRSDLVAATVELVQRYGFDGLDLDYECFWREGNEGPATEFIQELKAALLPHNLELTVSVPANTNPAHIKYDVAAFAASLDAVHLMVDDLLGRGEEERGQHLLGGGEEERVQHLAPLHSEQGDAGMLTVSGVVTSWLSRGVPSHKLVLGIPTYGRSWTLNSPSANRLGSAARRKGVLGYREICTRSLNTPTTTTTTTNNNNNNTFSQQEGWTVVRDPSGGTGPYAYRGDEWVGYDDPESARAKARYILEAGLGGAVFRDLALEDYSGEECGGGEYPIISAVHSLLEQASTTTC